MVKLTGYKKLGKYRRYNLHEHIRADRKKPRFTAIAESFMSIPDGTIVEEDENSVVDLRSKIWELELGTWGQVI